MMSQDDCLCPYTLVDVICGGYGGIGGGNGDAGCELDFLYTLLVVVVGQCFGGICCDHIFIQGGLCRINSVGC